MQYDPTTHRGFLGRRIGVFMALGRTAPLQLLVEVSSMKYLEAKQMQKEGGENKMRTGSRPDQGGIRKGQLQPDNPVPVKAEVRDLARSLKVDLGDLSGTGRNGEITLKDVRDAAEKQQKPTDK
jgi:pyruvate/2-oxoglutarate dehydrogenase complex dihydrolipoamide acyltransferase (E2) component